MKQVRISDVTLREGTTHKGATLSFKEKIEIAKLLDKLGADVIEMAAIENTAADTLLLKTLSSLLKKSQLAVVAGTDKDQIEKAFAAVSNAKSKRLIVSLPTSNVRMEYISHSKPAAMLDRIKELVSHACSLCDFVEFEAEDATRSEKDFLAKAVSVALEAGAKAVTICDTASAALPDEIKDIINGLYAAVPALKEVDLGVAIADEMGMANACALAAFKCGASYIKTAVSNTKLNTTEGFVHLIRLRGEQMGIGVGLNVTELSRTATQIKTIAKTRRSDTTPFDNKIGEGASFSVSKDSDISEISKAIKELGYTLSDDDTAKVYEAFLLTAAKKQVGAKELEAIVASEALQVPPTYKLVSYAVNCSNVIAPTAHIVVEKKGEELCGLSTGDGPIDAALLALEQIVGCHYELDDFQIQAVTEGREAMGEALIKLRFDGVLYSGRGISTDIMGASIKAYLNALNKIVYEED
ncbi:MAG: alpha-isopropylmalate synthase regulatory domain-containing protein [Ruminococcus sp.]|nr:alpha-isopropylmalate synthase regulatory domain-containing protein [Ruminococcus sp.]